MPLIIPANTLSGGYNVANSCRFNQPSGDYLNRTPSGAGNQKTFTMSCWYKKMKTGAKDIIMSTTDGGGTFFVMGFVGSGTHADKFYVYFWDGSTDYGYTTNRLFRDYSAWLNIVVSIDTTQGTESNRVKLYINGTEESLTATYGAFPQNHDTYFNDSNVHYIGYDHDAAGALFNGYLAELVVLDGTAANATSFGEFDEDSPTIWKPINVSGLTFGTNGFYLDFENASSLGADVSGNSNNFTVNNLTSIDQSTDTCTNNFATLNPLMGGRGSTLSEGNLKVTGESDNNYDVATFGSDMKWYYEWKVDENYDGSGGGVRLGAIHIDELSTNDNFSNFATTKVKLYTNSNDGKTQEGPGDNVITGLTRATTDNIIMCACDGTNAKIWWGINGTWLDYGSGTGDPANGNNSAPWSSNAMASGIYFPVICYSGTAAAGSLNLGNPPFSISSGNADANGYGNFEYAVPSGFYSLCTKNLAEFG